MKVGILITGRPPVALERQFSGYGLMCATLIEESDNGHNATFNNYALLEGQVPEDPNECDAWLITGSKHGVYEDHSWIKPLTEFVLRAIDKRKKVIGICFGHQLIAQALGGEVQPFVRGPAIGVSTYQSSLDNPKAPAPLSLYAWHYDQIISPPSSAEIILQSDFCSYAGLRYEDRAISFQPHPEFSRAYMAALIKHYSGSMLSQETIRQAENSLVTPVSPQHITRHIRQFLNEG